ncbi:conserved hypothetical protein [Candidatus Desulfarcum epimagneticum]|uniref:Uncharacterized protein n=1 Tax=uncultured Desulfobacteraceae bacterium TaxID=218296 RepID=A0A484HJ00_9BACT|nr:conserved hypothetical protein [uncultured Desulfobacteraceae bacterium]
MRLKSASSVRRPFDALFQLCLIAALCLALAGCGLNATRKNSVYAFGQAASTLGSAVSRELPAMRENVIEMKKLRLAIENRKIPNLKTRAAYEKKINIDSGLDPENISRHIGAMNLLTSYGNFLSAFARDAADEELRKNIHSLNEIKGLGRVAHAGGKLFIDWKKKKTIQKIVPMVSPLIQRLCDELEKNFDINRPGMALNVDIVQDRLYSEALDGLKRDSQTAADRLIQVRGFVMAGDSKKRLEQVSRKILDAAAALRKADREMVEMATGKKVSLDDIRFFADQTRDMVSALRAFGK